jgi:hypothetical protein
VTGPDVKASAGSVLVEWKRLQYKQVAEQENRVTVWARTTDPQCASECIAIGAALLSDGARLARGAFVHRVLGEQLPPLQLRL